MTDYPAGTIAAATVRGIEGSVRVMRVNSNLSSAEWASADGAGQRLHEPKDVTDVRPLVVLDVDYTKESREELLRVLRSNYYTSTADQIEAQTKPPAPAEPTGLGAVVADEFGELWVRDKTTTTVNHWKRARGEDGGRRYTYSNLRIVRVLSEGVTE